MAQKILLADDSVTIQKVISLTFAREGYELIVVGDGDSAIERTRSDSPDLVLADIAMPGRNGYEVSSALKGDPSTSSIPVLLLAGTFDPIDEGKRVQSRADDYIIKPFESQDLLDKVEALMGGASLEEAFEIEEEIPEASIIEVEGGGVNHEVSEEDIFGDLGGEAVPAASFGTTPDSTPASTPGESAEAGDLGAKPQEEFTPAMRSPTEPIPEGFQESRDTIEDFTSREEEHAPPPREPIEGFGRGVGAPPEQPPVTERVSETVTGAASAVAGVAAEKVSAGLPPSVEGILTKEEARKIIEEKTQKIVEEIAWEVVPDMVKELLREEFKKVKSILGKG